VFEEDFHRDELLEEMMRGEVDPLLELVLEDRGREELPAVVGGDVESAIMLSTLRNKDTRSCVWIIPRRPSLSQKKKTAIRLYDS